MLRYMTDMSERPELSGLYTGLPVTPRMKRWGIIGMVGYGEGWTVTDGEGCMTIPAAIGDWLAQRT